jgi:carboxypeptidase family protein
VVRAAAVAAVVLLLFAATLPAVQAAARNALALAGVGTLAVTLRGSVSDESGAPIANAFIRVSQGHELATTVTDGAGVFGVDLAIRADVPADVSVGASGYEAMVRDLRVAWIDPRFDARLHPVVRIDAGTSVHLTVGPGDGLCSNVRVAGEPQRSWPCRIVHVSGLEPGGLAVAVAGDDPRDRFGVTFGFGTQPQVILSERCCPDADSARVTSGEAFIQIVALGLENGQAAPGGRGELGLTLRTELGP